MDVVTAHGGGGFAVNGGDAQLRSHLSRYSWDRSATHPEIEVVLFVSGRLWHGTSLWWRQQQRRDARHSFPIRFRSLHRFSCSAALAATAGPQGLAVNFLRVTLRRSL
ncbi:hypothetical protein DPEC_G00047310 [Dallia pectoralis]|uniref:Uncharacterized protein n=1 Tax=Dallia pectoralis TaxID=75939 RepID=A0ACC2HA73_DALPE|nr:hypothetical protein DPEC_G00047310 [Dallia pectoralis]